MLIDHIVNVCDSRYKSHVPEGFPCNHCDQPTKCMQNCKKCDLGGNKDPYGCFNCCRDIHWHNRDGRQDYTCDHLIDYYTCRYSYKYCSEIIYAIDQIDLSPYQSLDIISLGCGPAPDLMSIDYLQEKGLYQRPVTYYGVDINNLWAKVHFDISAYRFLTKTDVSFDYYDVVDVFSDLHSMPHFNVIIIEYLISHLQNTGQASKIIGFYKGIIDNLVRVRSNRSPMLIILNDVDSCNVQGRDSYWILAELLRENGYNINPIAKCFDSNMHLSGSTKHSSNKGKIFIPQEIMRDYAGAYYCNSAQLIIEVE